MPNDDCIKRSDAVNALMTDRNLTPAERLETVNRIMSISAADVEPVRHGRWIPINRINPVWTQFGIAQHKCSECGNEETIARKRCPECGAKMDKE